MLPRKDDNARVVPSARVGRSGQCGFDARAATEIEGVADDRVRDQFSRPIVRRPYAVRIRHRPDDVGGHVADSSHVHGHGHRSRPRQGGSGGDLTRRQCRVECRRRARLVINTEGHPGERKSNAPTSQ